MNPLSVPSVSLYFPGKAGNTVQDDTSCNAALFNRTFSATLSGARFRGAAVVQAESTASFWPCRFGRPAVLKLRGGKARVCSVRM